MTTTESRHTVFWEIPDYLMKLKSFCRDYVTELDLNRYDTYLQLLVQLDKNSEKLQNALKKRRTAIKKVPVIGSIRTVYKAIT
jgi:flagellar basal body-associated protein FliL